MYERFCEKIINSRVVIYDRSKDIIKFSYNEDIPDQYSSPRLNQVAGYKTDIIITSKCSQKCINCFVDCHPDEVGEEMQYPILLSKIKEREDSKIRILITGGEPFLHSNINKILKLPLKFPDLNFAICSNGTGIRESHISLIKKYDWLAILSIHGDEATHNAYTRTISHEKILSTLGALAAVKARVKIYSVINGFSTKEDIDYLYKLKKEKEIISIKFMTPREYGRYTANYKGEILNYVKSRLDAESGLQETSSKTELILIHGDSSITN